MTAARRKPTGVQPLVLSTGHAVSRSGSVTPRGRQNDPSVYYAGPENRLVASAIGRLLAAPTRDASRQPRTTTLIGPPGSGKSLLAKGVVGSWIDTHGDAAVISLSGTDLRRRLEQAIAADYETPGSVTALADRIAAAELLVLEDLEGLAASPATVDLLTAKVDRLEETGATLLVTASRPLGEIEGLDARLVSRLSAGLTLEIAGPATVARQELLTAAIESRSGSVEPAAAADLAAWLPADARRVLAAAEKLLTRFGKNKPIGPNEARAFVTEASLDEASTPLADLANVVARYYKMPIRQLRSSSRKAPVVLARAVTIYLARLMTPLSYDEIGRYLGGRDHTTVMHSYNRLSGRMPNDRALRSAIADLLRRLGRSDLISLSTPLGEARESA